MFKANYSFVKLWLHKGRMIKEEGSPAQWAQACL